MNNNHVLTIEEQINKLKSQNLIIQNEEFTKKQLNKYGYFNIKSYRDPYVINNDDGKKIYRSGITFEQVFSLYILDKNIRNAVMASMLDLEEHIKAVTAEIIAHSFGSHQDDYLQFKNYRDKRRSQVRFSLTSILESMNKATKTDKNPVLHYRECHNCIPPWVLFKNLYFSTIINYINLFKTKEHELLATSLYDINQMNLSLEDLRTWMMDTLFICLEYRNLAAHGGRVYNYQCNHKLNIPKSYSILSQKNIFGFSQLLLLLNALNYKNPHNHLHKVLTAEVNRHCRQFPQDITYLGKILNMDIIPTNYVWVSESSNKYHRIPHCSGMQNPNKIDLNDAVDQGYIPCKKCDNSK